MAIRQQLVQWSQLVGRIILYGVIVYLFYQVFQSVKAEPNRVWYLAITEWVILSTSSVAFQISRDIQSGQIVYFMLRPMHYLVFRFCECMGTSLVRFILLGFCCFLLGFFLIGAMPEKTYLWTWITGILFSILGVLLYSLILVLIGLLSFWIKEIQVLVYLNLTATFCFGGLIVPLDFYSDFLKKISFCTPYPWILWWPAQWLTDTVNLSHAFLGWSFWMFFLVICIGILYEKCLKFFVVEGG